MKRAVLIILAGLLAGVGNAQTPDGKAGAPRVDVHSKSASGTGPAPCEDGLADDFYPCRNVDIASVLFLSDVGGGRGNGLNDLWGWEDPVEGRRYVLLGREDGTAFVDVTDPENPIYVGQLLRPDGVRASLWRDIKVYADHAFIVADSAPGHGMQVFDLTELRGATGAPPVTFSQTAQYTLISSAHNIVVDEDSGFAYAVGASSSTCGTGLHMIDVRSPAEPAFAGCFRDTRTGSGYTHDAQCVTYRGPHVWYQGHEICVASNVSAISVVDVTDKDLPRALGLGTYPAASYVHQGWFSDDHRYFFQDDEADERADGSGTRTMVWDLSNLEDPVLLTVFEPGTSAIDHNLYVHDGYLYQANYSAGLQIVNVVDPGTPVRVGWFDTTPGNDAADFSGTWSVYPWFSDGTIALSSRGEGLFLLRAGDLTAFRLNWFNAVEDRATVHFEWEVVGQRNLIRFVLERREPDGSYTPLASRPGSGTADAASRYEFSYDGLPPGRSWVRLVAEFSSGTTTVLAESEIFVVPGTHLLTGLFPNPASGSAEGLLAVAADQWVTVTAYDVEGRERGVLFHGYIRQGEETSVAVPSHVWSPGRYWLRFSGEHFEETRSMIVAR